MSLRSLDVMHGYPCILAPIEARASWHDPVFIKKYRACLACGVTLGMLIIRESVAENVKNRDFVFLL